MNISRKFTTEVPVGKLWADGLNKLLGFLNKHPKVSLSKPVNSIKTGDVLAFKYQKTSYKVKVVQAITEESLKLFVDAEGVTADGSISFEDDGFDTIIKVDLNIDANSFNHLQGVFEDYIDEIFSSWLETV